MHAHTTQTHLRCTTALLRMLLVLLLLPLLLQELLLWRCGCPLLRPLWSLETLVAAAGWLDGGATAGALKWVEGSICVCLLPSKQSVWHAGGQRAHTHFPGAVLLALSSLGAVAGAVGGGQMAQHLLGSEVAVPGEALVGVRACLGCWHL